MHDKSKFISWVEDPWIEVSNGSMFPAQLRKLEFVLRLGLKIPLFTPGVPIVLLSPQMFIIYGDVQLRMFLLTPTLLHAKPITNDFN